jgi:hypothetical protein
VKLSALVRRSSLPAIFVGGLMFSEAAPAQNLVLTGQVTGPDGQPVPAQAVLLHRVTNQGGELLAQSTTGDDGRFTLSVASSDPSGVFFVATRFRGQLYIGPLIRPPFPDGQEYVVQVGVAGVGDVQGLTAAAESARPPEPTRGLFPWALLAAALGAGVWLTIAGSGPSRRRRTLIRIAQLDERCANAADPPAAYARTRRQLLQKASDPVD